MSLESHIHQLSRKHAELERCLAEEENRPAADTRRIAEIKREKLRLKDEIARLTHH
ncbi:YdcH family protein [Futiania mangrovi]|uniref:DUF465 domain-containing protein n=1 Tax=Futiania mangrovi TaxID=2959716 RepID=A0A9J6PA55_9PROT|nr:DUF465 domain-containing protein [Futiania mangrovii]MCP1334862.1 DUF465 domain-containing protein [Futiania mangrovii]